MDGWLDGCGRTMHHVPVHDCVRAHMCGAVTSDYQLKYFAHVEPSRAANFGHLHNCG